MAESLKAYGTESNLEPVPVISVIPRFNGQVWLGVRTSYSDRHRNVFSAITRRVSHQMMRGMDVGDTNCWEPGFHFLPDPEPIIVDKNTHDYDDRAIPIAWAFGKTGLDAYFSAGAIECVATPLLTSLNVVPDNEIEGEAGCEMTAMLHCAVEITKGSEHLPEASLMYNPLGWVDETAIGRILEKRETVDLCGKDGPFGKGYPFCTMGDCMAGVVKIIEAHLP